VLVCVKHADASLIPASLIQAIETLAQCLRDLYQIWKLTYRKSTTATSRRSLQDDGTPGMCSCSIAVRQNPCLTPAHMLSHRTPADLWRTILPTFSTKVKPHLAAHHIPQMQECFSSAYSQTEAQEGETWFWCWSRCHCKGGVVVAAVVAAAAVNAAAAAAGTILLLTLRDRHQSRVTGSPPAVQQ
jgi:hypothetical protein